MVRRSEKIAAKEKVFGTNFYVEDSLISKKSISGPLFLSGRSKEDLKRMIALGLLVWLWNYEDFNFFNFIILNDFI